MPLHDVGYRGWTGTPRHGLAAGVIAGTGIRLTWKSRWLRRVLLFAWTPALIFAGGFFAFEQAVDNGVVVTGRAASWRLNSFGMIGSLVAQSLGNGIEDPDEARRLVWSRLLLAFMRAPQTLLLAVVVGLVAPRLISGDLRAKAWLVYFSRPVSRTAYILGKIGVLATVMGLVTLVPALVLWVLGVLVSPSISVAAATWDLPLRIIAAATAVTVPTVLLALAFSSLTAESRIATFAWFATWVACWITHGALSSADGSVRWRPPSQAFQDALNEDGIEDLPQALRRQSRDPRRLGWLAHAAGIDGSTDRWAWLSLFHAQGVVQAWIFGIEKRFAAVLPSLISLSAVAVTSLVVLFFRVDAPARA
jgi:ABC-type transport system involved in multi-copper enzyme maturation permease subunit